MANNSNDQQLHNQHVPDVAVEDPINYLDIGVRFDGGSNNIDATMASNARQSTTMLSSNLNASRQMQAMNQLPNNTHVESAPLHFETGQTTRPQMMQQFPSYQQQTTTINETMSQTRNAFLRQPNQAQLMTIIRQQNQVPQLINPASLRALQSMLNGGLEKRQSMHGIQQGNVGSTSAALVRQMASSAAQPAFQQACRSQNENNIQNNFANEPSCSKPTAQFKELSLMPNGTASLNQQSIREGPNQYTNLQQEQQGSMKGLPQFQQPNLQQNLQTALFQTGIPQQRLNEAQQLLIQQQQAQLFQQQKQFIAQQQNTLNLQQSQKQDLPPQYQSKKLEQEQGVNIKQIGICDNSGQIPLNQQQILSQSHATTLQPQENTNLRPNQLRGSLLSPGQRSPVQQPFVSQRTPIQSQQLPVIQQKSETPPQQPGQDQRMGVLPQFNGQQNGVQEKMQQATLSAEKGPQTTQSLAEQQQKPPLVSKNAQESPVKDGPLRTSQSRKSDAQSQHRGSVKAPGIASAETKPNENKLKLKEQEKQALPTSTKDSPPKDGKTVDQQINSPVKPSVDSRVTSPHQAGQRAANAKMKMADKLRRQSDPAIVCMRDMWGGGQKDEHRTFASRSQRNSPVVPRTTANQKSDKKGPHDKDNPSPKKDRKSGSKPTSKEPSPKKQNDPKKHK